MKRKVYSIKGFDCANCAAKAEAHLNKNSEINSCRIDFVASRLYITTEKKELSIDKIKALIAEVESDPLEIEELHVGKEKSKKIWDLHSTILLIRLIYCVAVILISGFLLKDYYWVRFGLYLSALVVIAYDIFWKVLHKIIHLKNPVDEYLLILLASIGAFTLASIEFANEGEALMLGSYSSIFFIEEHCEALFVVMLWQIGQIIESIAVNKSKEAVIKAVDLRSDLSFIEKDGEILQVNPQDIDVNDIVVLKAGDLVPVDGEVIFGEGYIDLSSITGEPVPRFINKDKQVFSGTLLKNGTVKIKALKRFEDSTANKIISLIEASGEKKARADKFITKFARFYTPIICLVAIFYLLIAGFVSKQWMSSIYTALEILVISCPCAIVISVPLAYFAAIGLASKNSIIVKGTTYFDEINHLKKVIADKTGTLTHGSFEIRTIKTNECTEEELLNALVVGECLSEHPIAKTICHGKNLKKLRSQQENFFEIQGFGNETTYQGKHYIVGNEKMMERHEIFCYKVNEVGTVVHAAIDDDYLGYVVLSDEIKEDAQPMVNLLHSEKVEIVLLTGDNEENAKSLCNKLGIDRWHSNLLPEDKIKYLEMEMSDPKEKVAFVGDGVNDAPAIKRSDIGIAMGAMGSDAAIENADVVIMNDDPAKIYDVHKIAKIARNTAIFNIIFALLVKITILVLAFIFKDKLPMEVAVFADTGVTVLLVINSLMILYRHVKRPTFDKKNKNV